MIRHCVQSSVGLTSLGVEILGFIQVTDANGNWQPVVTPRPKRVLPGNDEKDGYVTDVSGDGFAGERSGSFKGPTE